MSIQQIANKLGEKAWDRVMIQHFTWPRSVLCGAGLAFAAEKEKYWHMPITYLFPSAYAGYQVYKHRNIVRDYLTESYRIWRH